MFSGCIFNNRIGHIQNGLDAAVVFLELYEVCARGTAPVKLMMFFEIQPP